MERMIFAVLMILMWSNIFKIQNFLLFISIANVRIERACGKKCAKNMSILHVIVEQIRILISNCSHKIDSSPHKINMTTSIDDKQNISLNVNKRHMFLFDKIKTFVILPKMPTQMIKPNRQRRNSFKIISFLLINNLIFLIIFCLI